MNFLGILVWVVAILIALVPIIGLLAEFVDYCKEKTIRDYERGRDGEEQ